MPKLLIVDDDCALFALLEEYLGAAGYACCHAPDGNAGLAATAAEPWDLIILDVMVIGKDSMTVLVGGNKMEITSSELRLLELFAESPGTAIPRAELHEKITGRKLFVQDRSLDMMISRLKKKLGARCDGGERIRAARNEGYMFLLSGGRE